MILNAAGRALSRMFTPQFRGALFKALGLTLLLLAALWVTLGGIARTWLFPWIDSFMPALPEWAGWFGLLAAIAAGIGLALALALLIAPVTAIIAGLFLDDVAETVERLDYPADPPGTAVPPLRALVLALKFFAIVVAGNLLALLLLLVPGVNIFAFFIINGYLLGREFFEFAAMRHRPEAEAKAIRARHAGTVFLAGLLIAAFLAVPIVNLAVPIFAAAMMVYLYKSIAAREGARAPG